MTMINFLQSYQKYFVVIIFSLGNLKQLPTMYFARDIYVIEMQLKAY